jgi:hypothetical protein
MTALELLSRADIHPGNAHRDNVAITNHPPVKKRWGVDRCTGCGALIDTNNLRWLTRIKRICLECRLQNEKDARRMRTRCAGGAG